MEYRLRQPFNNVNIINSYYFKNVNIATDPDYDSQLISEMIEPVPNNHLPLHNIYKHEVFQLETSRGPDKLPYWFFRYAASDITAVVSRLI